jgi:3-oxoacyl-(acyl-carrier-protein) synthase
LSTRIVATGTGIICSLAAGAGDFETELYAGHTGIGPKTLFADTVPGAAGEVRAFAPQQWLGSKGLRVLDRSARLLCVATHMALNSTISAGLVSGLYAIHYAMEFLRFGRAQALLAGGVEELCEESYLSCRKAGVTSPTDRICPFSPDRDGTVLGEGSALWVLETEESAARRGARPILELCGFGSAHDAQNIDSFNVRGTGATTAIEQALQAAGVGPEAVGFIIASASGSPAGDAMEIHALRNIFGARLSRIPVCAPKAAFGESLGASGALLAVTAGIALQKGLVPPTVGFEKSDSELRLSSRPEPFDGSYALVNCFGCDGNNAALVLQGMQGRR